MLGAVGAEIDGSEVDLGAPMQRALLATLLLRRNEVVPRDRLVEALWGERPPQSAPGSLQVYVHGLRRALGRDRIETAGTGYRAVVEPGELDLERFESLVARARAALAAGRPAAAAADLTSALAIPEGAPLADLVGREAVDAVASQLDDLLVEAGELLNDAELALAENERVAARSEALVAAHPFRERLREQQVVALYRAGRQTEALDAYREARRALVDELGVEPGPSLRALELAVLRHDPALRPPVARPRRATSLPAMPPPLIGRDRDVHDLVALLARDDVRQVTLTGAGGSGKTRLALAAAEELATQLRDGAAFVDLAPLTDEALVLPSIAAAVGLDDRDEHLDRALADDLRDRAMLLVLDNFEHLRGAAPVVSTLLRDAPQLLVLVTSRVPLRLSWEHELQVAPLAVPREDAGIAELRDNDAVRLFVTRARAADSSFALTDASWRAVGAICRGVDGLPLAIELAAARVRAVPPAAMAERLGGLLPLLRDGPVDVPERQRTLEAAVAWSWDMLDEREQRVLARLSVFAGCTEQTAAVVDPDPADALESLADHSLLRRREGAHGGPRFTMLETIREFALSRLRAGGDEDEWRRRHAEAFVRLAEAADAEITTGGTDPAPVLRRLEAEHDNIRAALGWLHASGAAELELRLASALAYFWRVRGHLGEGRMWLTAAIATTADVPAALRARATSSAGRLAYRQGDFATAETLQREALALARDARDLRATGQALSDLGGIALAESDLGAAEGLYGESAEVLREAGHDVRLGTVLVNLATIALARSDPTRATALAHEARELQQRTGDKEGAVFAHLTLARAALCNAQHEDAEVHLRQARDLIDELEYREVHGYWLLACAELAAQRGCPDRAARLLGRAEAELAEQGVTQLQADDAAVRDAVVAQVTEALGRDAFLAARAEGGISDDEALRGPRA